MNRTSMISSKSQLPIFLAVIIALVGWHGSASGHEVLVCSYFTAVGRGLATPTNAHPAFYSLVTAPVREWSDSSGSGEGLGLEGMRRLLRGALSANRFLPEEKSQSANLIIVYHWGLVTPILQDAGTSTEQFFNRAEMLGIISGRALEHFDERERTLVITAAREDRFFMIVSAYVADDWVKNKRRTLLWRTHMSLPSHQLTPRNAAPILLAAGGPLFGRDSIGLRPVTINVSGILRRDADVRF